MVYSTYHYTNQTILISIVFVRINSSILVLIHLLYASHQYHADDVLGCTSW